MPKLSNIMMIDVRKRHNQSIMLNSRTLSEPLLGYCSVRPRAVGCYCV